MFKQACALLPAFVALTGCASSGATEKESIEKGEGYVGKRLSLTKIGQEDDAKKTKSLRRRNLPDECDEGKTRYLVHFRIDGVRPLIGTEQ